MKILFFDTETTGFPSRSLNIDDPKQPAICQLAAMLMEGDKLINQISCIVKVGDKTIHPGAEKVHGISQDYSNEVGLDPLMAVMLFHAMLLKADQLVAHNLDFDLAMMRIEYVRHNLDDKFLDAIDGYCTMTNSTDICQLPGKFGKFKWPKLEEAYKILVDENGFEGAHDALVDVRACIEVYKKLTTPKKSFLDVNLSD